MQPVDLTPFYDHCPGEFHLWKMEELQHVSHRKKGDSGLCPDLLWVGKISLMESLRTPGPALMATGYYGHTPLFIEVNSKHTGQLGVGRSHLFQSSSTPVLIFSSFLLFLKYSTKIFPIFSLHYLCMQYVVLIIQCLPPFYDYIPVSFFSSFDNSSEKHVILSSHWAGLFNGIHFTFWGHKAINLNPWQDQLALHLSEVEKLNSMQFSVQVIWMRPY